MRGRARWGASVQVKSDVLLKRDAAAMGKREKAGPTLHRLWREKADGDSHESTSASTQYQPARGYADANAWYMAIILTRLWSSR
jgi:hypothetical protein